MKSHIRTHKYSSSAPDRAAVWHPGLSPAAPDKDKGLIPLSDALDARAVMDLAQVALVHSRYQERIAVANLELAMGLTLVPEQKSEPKAEK